MGWQVMMKGLGGDLISYQLIWLNQGLDLAHSVQWKIHEEILQASKALSYKYFKVKAIQRHICGSSDVSEGDARRLRSKEVC